MGPGGWVACREELVKEVVKMGSDVVPKSLNKQKVRSDLPGSCAILPEPLHLARCHRERAFGARTKRRAPRACKTRYKQI